MSPELAAVVHDLAQAVNIVTINAELLDQAIPGGELREVVTDLRGATHRLPQLIARLRAL